jgi:hypothetical protein
MRRRKFILGTGVFAASSAGAIQTGAFTSASAKRGVSVAVAGDDSALLAIEGCEGSNGNYVTGAESGTATLDISPSNDDVGNGVNPDAETVIHNVIELTNQGTQPVGVWLDVDPVEKEIQGEPNKGRVQFYLNSDRGTEIVGVDNAKCLGVGESICIGLYVDTRGLRSGADLFNSVSGDHEMVVNADVDVACDVPGTGEPDDPARTLYLSDSGPDPTNLYTVELTSSGTADLTEVWPDDDSGDSDFNQTDAIAATSDGSYVYLYDKASGHLGAYDVANDSFTDLGAVTDGPSDVVLADFAPDGTLWVASQTSDALYTVSNVNPNGSGTPQATEEIQLDIDVQGADLALTFMPDSMLYLWTSAAGDEGLYVIDPDASSPTATAIGTPGSYGSLQLTGLSLKTVSGDILLGSDTDQDQIVEIDTEDGSIGTTYAMELGGSDYSYDFGDMAAPSGTVVVDEGSDDNESTGGSGSGSPGLGDGSTGGSGSGSPGL